jgi:hypothetical protein
MNSLATRGRITWPGIQRASQGVALRTQTSYRDSRHCRPVTAEHPSPKKTVGRLIALRQMSEEVSLRSAIFLCGAMNARTPARVFHRGRQLAPRVQRARTTKRNSAP